MIEVIGGGGGVINRSANMSVFMFVYSKSSNAFK